MNRRSGRPIHRGAPPVRAGIAIGVVLICAACFAMMVFGMMKYSSSEMRNVSRLVDKKRAEYLAYAGINWAAVELAKGRWYQPPGEPPVKVQRPAWGEKTLEPFGPGNGRVRVVCQEAGRIGVDVRGDDLYGRFDKVDLLDHIKVYALGEMREEKALYYGKFIMSPDPYLNSDRTDAPGTGGAAAAPARPGSNLVNILIPRAWSQDGAVSQVFTVTAVNVAPGQVIDINTICCTLAPTIAITQSYDVKGPTYGRLKRVNVTVGQTVNADDVFGVMEEDCGSVVPSMTLKKMVQINHVDLRLYEGLDLTDPDTLHRVGQDAMGVAKTFIVNYAKNREVSQRLPVVMQLPSMGEKTTEAEMVARIERAGNMPTYDVDRAGNRFILEMLERWHPDGFNLTATGAAAFASASVYNLGHRRGHPRAEIKEILEGSGNASRLAGLYETKPWQNEGFHKIQPTSRYTSMLGDQFNEGMSTRDLIDGLSFLQNARRNITVVLAGGTPLEDGPFRAAVASGTINPADYWWWQRRNGWYAKPSSITGPTPSSVAYTYENDTTNPPIRLRVDYLLNYLRKHYDEGGVTAFSNRLRMPSDQNDTPQAPGPPDSTGARYSGGT